MSQKLQIRRDVRDGGGFYSITVGSFECEILFITDIADLLGAEVAEIAESKLQSSEDYITIEIDAKVLP